jgi:hypothetical protein
MRNFFRAAVLATLMAWPAYPQVQARPLTAYLPAVGKTVGTSATALATVSTHSFVMVWNTDVSLTLYVAFDSTVTTSSGMPIPPGQYLAFSDLGQGQLLYGVTTSGTLNARVQEGFSR